MTFHAGPWRVSRAAPTKTRGIDILTSDGKLIACVRMVHERYQLRDKEIGTARLIAEAPNMADTLRIIASYTGKDEAAQYAAGIAKSTLEKAGL